MNLMSELQENSICCGTLPIPAPLANPYVPFQTENIQPYQSGKGLVRGTMFPGLDLPFMNMVNSKELSNTATHRLQALHFAISELGLYLDTHPQDQDALDLFNQYVETYEDALQKFEESNGPTVQMRSGMSGTYRWVDGPWPWDYNANREG